MYMYMYTVYTKKIVLNPAENGCISIINNYSKGEVMLVIGLIMIA